MHNWEPFKLQNLPSLDYGVSRDERPCDVIPEKFKPGRVREGIMDLKGYVQVGRALGDTARRPKIDFSPVKIRFLG